VTGAEFVGLLHAMGATPSVEGGDFTELDHGLQCAFELARRFPEDVELQLAGLVHDVGHRFGPDDAHGRIGAEVVGPVLGPRVAALVAAHVPAKRYLVATEPGYRERLSPDSVRTLALQGGDLAPEEVRAFAAWTDAPAAVALRRADEAAKVPGRVVPTLDDWIPVLHGALR
jgi:predicted HD phosphohydrolase